MTMLWTNRLALSPIGDADADFVLELLNDPGWIANIGDRGVRTVEDARAYIAERFAANGWFLARDAAGERLGVCGLLKREQLEHPDLGYAFLRRHSGRGYATEAAQAVLRHAREVLGHNRIAAFTAPDNQASRRVLEKIGFVFQGLRDLPGLATIAYFLI